MIITYRHRPRPKIKKAVSQPARIIGTSIVSARKPTKYTKKVTELSDDPAADERVRLFFVGMGLDWTLERKQNIMDFMKAQMTLDDLAVALRGMPRNAVMMIETSDGIKPLRLARAAFGQTNADGEVSTSTGKSDHYLIILSDEL